MNIMRFTIRRIKKMQYEKIGNPLLTNIDTFTAAYRWPYACVSVCAYRQLMP